MRIKSNFTDYYDGFQAQDTDKETIWIRQPSKIVYKVIDKNWPQEKQRFLSAWGNAGRKDSNDHHWILMAIAGKLYVGYYWSAVTKWNGYRSVIIEPARVTYDPNLFPKSKNYFWSEKTQHEWYKRYLTDEKLIASLFEEYGPIWMIGGHECLSEVCVVNINPRLADWGLHKILPIHEVYSELYKFVCNMRRPVRDVPEMPNDIKIHQAGFDLKKSFRKAKT